MPYYSRDNGGIRDFFDGGKSGMTECSQVNTDTGRSIYQKNIKAEIIIYQKIRLNGHEC